MKWILKEEEIQCSAAGGFHLHPGTSKLLPQIALWLYFTPG